MKKLIVFIFVYVISCITSMSVMAESTAPKNQYLLGAGDHIQILVYNEENLSMNFIVDSSGKVMYPLIGELQLIGKTLDQVSVEIQNRLKNGYIKNPMVTVTMRSFRDFYVSGEVKSPGNFEYHPGLTLEQAIAIAGGFTDRADRDDVSIRLKNGQLLEDVLPTQTVNPGDTLIIDQSFF
ncbi:polysaccharide export protein [Photobacterium damselae subsp. damselae]|nr:capsular biosynthesis protein [Photobacterium damselae subsp. damselae]QAY34424.1 polysaccharide export protein [Photobacterium damselae subsp. damselae]